MDERLDQLIALGRAHIEREEFEAAELVLQEALGIDEGHAEIFNLLAVIARKNGDPTAAITFFQRAVELSPTYTDALNNLASIYSELGDFRATNLVYARLLGEADPKPRVLDALARTRIADLHATVADAYAEVGCREDAIHELRKGVSLCPSATALQTRLGTLYREDGHPTLARLHYEAARAANPRYVPARVLLGVTLLSLGAIDEAIAEWREALAIEPENRSAKMYLRMIEAQRSIRPPKPSAPPVPEEPLR